MVKLLENKILFVLNFYFYGNACSGLTDSVNVKKHTDQTNVVVMTIIRQSKGFGERVFVASMTMSNRSDRKKRSRSKT